MTDRSRMTPEVRRAHARERKRRQQQREAAGLLVIRDLVLPEAVADVLVESHWLDRDLADRPEKIRDALQRMLASLTAEDVEAA